MTRLPRRAWLAVAIGAALLLFGVSAGPHTTTPAMTVRAFFLYIRRGAMESAWQELDLPLQEHRRPSAAVVPDGAVGTSLGWPSQAAFARLARADLASFLRGARLTQRVGTWNATVVARSPAGAILYVSLHRVDNEWVFERLIESPRA